MVREINGLGGVPGNPPTTDRNTKMPSEPATAGSSQGAAATVDEVQLSSEAKTLQSLTDKVKDLPEVNLERAEKIKAALENGEYRIDDLVLAEKMLNIENLLSN